MALINWLDGLPCPALPIAFEIESFVAQDEAEVGAPRARARFTRELMRWSTNVPRLTRQQAIQLREFRKTTLNRGAKPFNIPAPMAQANGQPQTIEVRMVGPLRFERAGVSGVERWNAMFDLQEV